MQPKRSIIRAVVMTCINHVFVTVSLKKKYIFASMWDHLKREDSSYVIHGESKPII